jgi:hypothetical protein
MAGRTISAYADGETATAIERIAHNEDRPPAQVAAAALRFYALLPPEAHAAFRRIEKLGTPADADRLAREISRKTLDAQWEVAHRQFVAELQTEVEGQGGDQEDEILAEAVRLTR